MTPGHVHSSSLRSLALTALRLASHHRAAPLAVYRGDDDALILSLRFGYVPAMTAAFARSSRHALHRVPCC
ncbi:MAG: hypothetical protein WC295_00485 [Methanoregula sp.]